MTKLKFTAVAATLALSLGAAVPASAASMMHHHGMTMHHRMHHRMMHPMMNHPMMGHHMMRHGHMMHHRMMKRGM